MTERDLIVYCSPTLASLKTANLFHPTYASEEELAAQLEFWNRTLVEKGVALRVLRRRSGRALLYVYRPSALARDLEKPETARFLRRYGYVPGSAEAALEQLTRRMACTEGFPHEIGVFLGYPLADVVGFIENRGQNSKCSGLWKVYGDEKEAKRLFRRFRKCSNVYARLWQEGRSVWQLTVAA